MTTPQEGNKNSALTGASERVAGPGAVAVAGADGVALERRVAGVALERVLVALAVVSAQTHGVLQAVRHPVQDRAPCARGGHRSQ